MQSKPNLLLSVFAALVFAALLGVLVALGLDIRDTRDRQARLTEVARATGTLAHCASLTHSSSQEWWMCLGSQQTFLGADHTGLSVGQGNPASRRLSDLSEGDFAAIQAAQFAEIQRLARRGDTLLRWLLGLTTVMGTVTGAGLLTLSLWRTGQATRRRLELEAHQLLLDHASVTWRSSDHLPWLEHLCLATGAYNLTLWRSQEGWRLVGHVGLGVALTDWQAPSTPDHETLLTHQGRALVIGLGVLDTPLVLVARFRGWPSTQATALLGKLGAALTSTLNRQTLLERLAHEVDLNSAMIRVSKLLADPIGPPEVLRGALDVLAEYAGLRQLPAEPSGDLADLQDWLSRAAADALAARGEGAVAFTHSFLQVAEEALLGVAWRLPGHSGQVLFDWDGHDEHGLARLSQHIERTLGAAVERYGLLSELQEAALWDSLTNVRNRRAFDADLGRRVHSRRAGERGFALAMLDLDGFKAVNDLHGHERGDELLRRFARYLRTAIREEDILYRLGGDEFAVILHGARPDTLPVIESRLRAFADSLLGGPFAGVTVSVGSAAFPDETAVAQELLHLADQRMYEDKRARRHRRPLHAGHGDALSN